MHSHVQLNLLISLGVFLMNNLIPLHLLQLFANEVTYSGPYIEAELYPHKPFLSNRVMASRSLCSLPCRAQQLQREQHITQGNETSLFLWLSKGNGIHWPEGTDSRNLFYFFKTPVGWHGWERAHAIFTAK